MLLSHNLVINHGAWRRVDHRSIYSFEEAGRNFLVDKNEEQSWLITWLERLNCFTKLPIWSFEPQTMLLHGRTSNSVPINDYLLRNLTIVFPMEVFESFNDKLLELIGSILAEPWLLLWLWLIYQIFLNCLCSKLVEVLSCIRIRGGWHPNNRCSTALHDIQSNEHSVQLFDLLG